MGITLDSPKTPGGCTRSSRRFERNPVQTSSTWYNAYPQRNWRTLWSNLSRTIPQSTRLLRFYSNGTSPFLAWPHDMLVSVFCSTMLTLPKTFFANRTSNGMITTTKSEGSSITTTQAIATVWQIMVSRSWILTHASSKRRGLSTRSAPDWPRCTLKTPDRGCTLWMRLKRT